MRPTRPRRLEIIVVHSARPVEMPVLGRGRGLHSARGPRARRNRLFEDTLTVLGFGLSISTWWTGIHDLVTTFLGYLRVIDQRAYEDAMSTPTPFRTMLWTLMIGYAAWFVVIFTKGVGAAHRLRVARAAAAGTLGFFGHQGVFVIFNR